MRINATTPNSISTSTWQCMWPTQGCSANKKGVGTLLKKLVILKQLETHFKAKHEKSVGTPVPRIPPTTPLATI